MIVNDKLTTPIFLDGVIHEHFDETMYHEEWGIVGIVIFLTKMICRKNCGSLPQAKLNLIIMKVFRAYC